MTITFVPVPSGRLVLANDLRRLTGHVRGYSVDTSRGELLTVLEYAVYGMGFVPVGNSDPMIVRQGEDIEITTAGDRATALGNIETSLWWVCAMD